MPSILGAAFLAAALTAAPTVSAATPAPAPGYRLVELGTLGGDNSFVSAMNNRGDVVGRAQATDGSYRGFLWRHGRMTDLGAFTPTDVNDRGQVVGYPADGSGGYVWDHGVVQPLGPSALPLAINNRGQVVGRTDEGPVLWTNGHARSLPLTEVSDINEHGQVSGGVYLPPDGFHAVRWHSGRVTDLGAGPFNRSNTYALNDRGRVIGWQFSADQFPRGILWRHGRALDVGTLGGNTTELRAINNRGEILATSAASDGISRPALWRRGVLHDLSLAGISMYGEFVGLDDRGRIAASIRTVSGVRAVVYHPR